MDGPWGIMLNEMSDRERQILYALTYMWNLKRKKKTLMNTENIWVVARGERWGKGEMCEDGENVQTSRYKVNLNSGDVIYSIRSLNVFTCWYYQPTFCVCLNPVFLFSYFIKLRWRSISRFVEWAREEISCVSCYTYRRLLKRIFCLWRTRWNF